MHHDVAYVLIIEKPLLFPSVELEDSHSFDRSLALLFIRFHALGAQIDLQICLRVLRDLTRESDRALSSQEFKFEKDVGFFDEDDLGELMPAQLDIPFLLCCHYLLHLLLELDQLFVHFVLFRLKFLEVMADLATQTLPQVHFVQLSQLVQHLIVF